MPASIEDIEHVARIIRSDVLTQDNTRPLALARATNRREGWGDKHLVLSDDDLTTAFRLALALFATGR